MCMCSMDWDASHSLLSMPSQTRQSIDLNYSKSIIIQDISIFSLLRLLQVRFFATSHSYKMSSTNTCNNFDVGATADALCVMSNEGL